MARISFCARLASRECDDATKKEKKLCTHANKVLFSRVVALDWLVSSLVLSRHRVQNAVVGTDTNVDLIHSILD